ncbi:Uncharacterized protein dnm_078830 [Desulfonema magnum]|uniref:Uncharacterized protein n=1 Tax=Desulfonema magnum TaxID=45655 RepID=A0A975BV56_9BACT|nr:Uncharacterized protein dnm_078830 [Desulfonema magnum]
MIFFQEHWLNARSVYRIKKKPGFFRQKKIALYRIKKETRLFPAKGNRSVRGKSRVSSPVAAFCPVHRCPVMNYRAVLSRP